jgi:indole-3-glycerol phosphate synthase
MAAILTEIAEHVRGVVRRRRHEMPLAALRDRPSYSTPARGFASALAGDSRRIVAEVKKASPSKGLIRPDFDPVSIARAYAAHGASAISVLTEERFFHGSLGALEQIHQAVQLPVLRKDFILDSYQLVEAKSYGADAVLLIAALLEAASLRDLREQATALGLDAVLEVHTAAELDAALRAGAQIVGLNNRDLRTFEVDLAVSETLARLLPPGVMAICESGIDSAAQIRRVEAWGIHAFLIGESLMRAPEPGKKLRELLM